MTSWGLDQHALAAGEWWQLWTCHLVHWDAKHLAMNVLAALPPLMLAPQSLRRQIVPWTICIAPLLSLILIAAGVGGEYRGASGLVVGIWVFTGLCSVRNGNMRVGLALLACMAVKLTAESFHIMPAASGSFATLSLVHYAGAALGTVSGLRMNLR